MGNPFLNHFPDILTLDSRNCVDESVVAALHTLEETGKKQYQEFVKKILEDRTRSIHDPIKKNSLACFKKPQLKAISKQRKKIEVLQNNVEHFGQLYIAMQSRDGDLREFFAHEIQSFLPSLSDFGKLHLPNTKSELDLTRFNKIAIPKNKFQMASGQGSHWLIESPTVFLSITLIKYLLILF